MRDVSIKNIIEVHDGITGDIHELQVKEPGNQARLSYRAALVIREDDGVKDNSIVARLEHAGDAIVGFTKGTFGKDGKAFSSDPADEDYLQEWLAEILISAPDIVEKVVYQVFEGSRLQGVAKPGKPKKEKKEKKKKAPLTSLKR